MRQAASAEPELASRVRRCAPDADRDEPARLSALRDEIPGATVVANDAASRDAGDELSRAVDTPLDGVWLNAGRATVGGVEQIDAHDFDALFATNVRGPFLQLAALSPLLNDGSAVLVTSSTSAYEAAAGTSLYAATKAA